MTCLKYGIALLCIVATGLCAADKRQFRGMEKFLQSTNALCAALESRGLQPYLAEQDIRMLACVNHFCKYHRWAVPREVVFSEQLIQPYLSAKEAYGLVLTNKFNSNQVELYRLKCMNEFHAKFCLAHDSKETCNKNHTLILDNGTAIESRSVVFDISGNNACGVSVGCKYVVVFGAYAAYQCKREVKISTNLSDEKPHAFIATDNRILGACFFGATGYVENGYANDYWHVPCVVIYLPTGRWQTYQSIDKARGMVAYCTKADSSTITITKKVPCTTASFVAVDKIYQPVTDIEIPIFTVNVACLSQVSKAAAYQDALEDLHNYSTS